MNFLQVGLAPKSFDVEGLLIVDEWKGSGAQVFNPRNCGFNPLPMKYREAREFASILFGTEGHDTLTVRNGKRALTRMLMKADRIDRIEPGKSDEEKEAAALVEDLLLSPVLRKVLCTRQRSFPLQGNIVAKLNRAEIGEHDAYILGNLLISQYKGQITIPDFGFYARPLHTSLIREQRLIAGLYTLSELEPKLRQMCLLMEKVGKHCTRQDAEILASYKGLTPSTNAYDDFMADVMEEV